MTNLDIKRLADVVLEDPRRTSQFVENQFPTLYKNEGRELVELVKSYYRFLESESNQSTRNIRQIYNYRDIDKTLDSMLLFFKNKFLNGLFFDEDSRFIVKHILDLYRRKGSKEGIELFFRLFFEDEIEVYYPSFDMFKPSQSSWREGKYIQLNPITDVSVFSDVVNRKIFGSISAAEAFVDNVFFINIRDSIIPIVFISSSKGVFRAFDVIFSNDPFVEYGSVYGSLIQVNIDPRDTALFSSNNRVGDRVNIISSSEGIGAVGRISEISENFSGEIDFSIDDGGFAYTVNSVDNEVSESVVFVSQQLLFIENAGREFRLDEKIRQLKPSTVEVIGIVVGQKNDSIGIVLDGTAPDSANADFFFESGINIETIDRDIVLSKEVLFATEFNDTASFEVGELTNKQSVTIVTDVIEDFLTVVLDSTNYNDTALTPFSGTDPVNLSTPLNEAFSPKEFEIGTISKIKNINPGSNYQGDAFVMVKETLFSRFDLRNQIITTSSVNVNFLIGDIVTQQRTISNFYGIPEIVVVKGKVVDVFGNNIFVKSLTFEQFVLTEPQMISGSLVQVPIPIFKQGIAIPINTTSITKDPNSIQAGLNAELDGNVSLATGKIKNVEVIDSGFGYNKDERVIFMNITKKDRILAEIAETQDEAEIEELENLLQFIEINGDGFGQSIVDNQGKTEGRWTTFESHINQEKVIQDSFFYQDYSYEISSSVPVSVFEETYRNLVHPAGMKFFGKFAKTELINNENDILISRNENFEEIANAEEYLEIGENGFVYLIAEE
jgi:hypothetical protein